MNAFSSLKDYSSIHHCVQAEDASPHRFIQMLLAGALERIAQAKGAILQAMPEVKGERINKAIDIVNGLRGCLDDSEGGDLAANLDALYEYMVRRLLDANTNSDIAALDEVAKLLSEIKQAWDAIESQATAGEV